MEGEKTKSNVMDIWLRGLVTALTLCFISPLFCVPPRIPQKMSTALLQAGKKQRIALFPSHRTAGHVDVSRRFRNSYVCFFALISLWFFSFASSMHLSSSSQHWWVIKHLIDSYRNQAKWLVVMLLMLLQLKDIIKYTLLTCQSLPRWRSSIL